MIKFVTIWSWFCFLALPVLGAPFCVVETTLTVEVDYDLSLEEMIARGRYDFIADEFRYDYWTHVRDSKGKHTEHLAVVRITEPADSGKIIGWIRRSGMGLADSRELLAVSEQYPELQREGLMLVAFGSTFIHIGEPGVPILFMHGAIGRMLGVVHFFRPWEADNSRFLVRLAQKSPAI